MSHARKQRWTEAEFLAWLPDQDGRHELVDGAPQAMTGGSQRHNLIAMNTYEALRAQLRGGPCRPSPFNTAVRIPLGNLRYPDVTVDCGPFQPDAFVASEPTLVVEVLSPSTRAFDQTQKLEEYRSVASMRHVLVLDPDAPRARLHSRADESGWDWFVAFGADASVALPGLGIALPLGALYAGLPT